MLCEGNKRVGVEYVHLTLNKKYKLTDALGGSGLTDIGVPTMQMRMIKSAEEISLFDRAHALPMLAGWQYAIGCQR
jgi:creatinase